MRTIEYSTRFKRDYKREAKGRFRSDIDAILMPVLRTLSRTNRWMRNIMITIFQGTGAATGNAT